MRGFDIMKLTVLIVDDDSEITKSTGIFLRAEGYRVLEAHDGLVNEEVHLVLLDIMMPELDGISTLMKLRDTKNIPVILITRSSFC